MEGELAAASVEPGNEDEENFGGDIGGEVDDEAVRQERAMEKEERLTLLAGDLPEVMLSWRGEVPWWRKEAEGEGDREEEEDDDDDDDDEGERKIREMGMGSGMRSGRADQQVETREEENSRAMNSVGEIAA